MLWGGNLFRRESVFYVVIILIIFAVINTSCNFNSIMLFPTQIPYPTYTPYPTFTPYPAKTPTTTNTPKPSATLFPTATEFTSCYTGEEWKELANKISDYQVFFTQGASGWDREWTIDKSPYGIYGLSFEERNGCISRAMAYTIIDFDKGNSNIAGDMFGLLQRYFDKASNTDDWFQDNLDRCETEDVQKKLLTMTRIWEFVCEFNPDDGLFTIRLVVDLP